MVNKKIYMPEVAPTESSEAQPAETAVATSPSEKKMELYKKALEYLVRFLSLTKPRLLNVDDFYNEFELRPSFLNAIRDLNGIQPDFSIRTEGNELYLVKTPLIRSITPEEVSQKIKNKPWESNLLQEAARIRETFDNQEQLARMERTGIPMPAISSIPQIPVLTEPYEITIKTAKGSFTQQVENMQHVDMVMNVLMVLNRVQPLTI